MASEDFYEQMHNYFFQVFGAPRVNPPVLQKIVPDEKVQQAIEKQWTVVAKINTGVVIQKTLSLDQILKHGVEKAKQAALKEVT